MKKFLLIVMAVAVTGSFTSCVENEIPDEVIAIYDGQAEFLAAQAALAEAQAAEATARAAAEQARANFVQAQADVEAQRAEMMRIANEQQTAENALELERLRAEVDAQIAAQLLAAEQARLDALQAQIDFDEAQRQLQLAIASAEEAAIQAAYLSYLSAVTTVNNLTAQEITDRLAVLQQMAAVNAAIVSDANAQATLEAAIEAEQTTIADLEAQIADLEALLASGDIADYNDLKDEYEARIAEIDAIIDAWTIDVELANQALAAANADVTATGAATVMAEYNALQQQLTNVLFGTGAGPYSDSLEDLRNAVENSDDDIEDQEDLIAFYQNYVDNYDTVLAAFEQAVADAETALADAEAAEDAAEEERDDAIDARDDAQDALDDAEDDLDDLQDDVDDANDELDDAAQELADAIAARDAADLPSLEADLAAAQADFNGSIAHYEEIQDIFAAGPNDQSTGYGADGRDGNTDDASPNTYAEIIGITPEGDAYYGATIYTDITDVPGGAANVFGGTHGTITVAEIGEYFDIEADNGDLRDNTDLLDQAADARDANEARVEDAQDAVDDFADLEQDVVDAQAEYDYREDVFDNSMALLMAQQAVVDAAQDDLDAAQDALDDAEDALDDAEDAVDDAEDDLDDAEDDLGVAGVSGFLEFTETQYQDLLQEAIADLEYIIDESEEDAAELAMRTALADELSALIDAGPVVSAEQQAALDAQAEATMELNALLALAGPLNTERANLVSLVTIIDGILNVGTPDSNSRESIEMTIEGLQMQLGNAQDDLATAQTNLELYLGGSTVTAANLNGLAVAAAEAELERRQAAYDATVALLAAWEARAERRLEILNSLL